MLQTTVLEEDSIKFVAMKRKYDQEIKQLKILSLTNF